MTIRMFRSTDRGVPVLTGQQGKMGDLLLELLCKGLPAVTPTGITQSGGLATVNHTGHGYLSGQDVTVYGAAQAGYNGVKNITVSDANTYTFACDSGTVSPATGTIYIGGQVTIGTCGVTRSGTTCTVNLTGHGFSVGHRSYILGADQPEYNGWQTVATVTDADNFTFELPASLTPTTPATGTIYGRYGDAGLGWSMPYTASNKRVFQQEAKASLAQHVLIINETDASYNTFGAGMYMAESATSTTSFTGLYYSTERTQYCGTMKSYTADATARKWVVLGDGRTVIILTQPGYSAANVSASGWMPSYFGDIVSYLPGDTAPILCAPCVNGTYAFNNYTLLPAGGADASTFIGYLAQYAYAYSDSETTNHPLRMKYNHLAQSGYIQPILLAMQACPYINNPSSAGSSRRAGSTDSSAAYNYFYPDPVHGGFNVDELHVAHATTASNTGNPVIRGKVRGLHTFLHNRASLPVSNNDTLDGAGVFAGKRFEIFDFTYKPTDFGCFLIETSDTWSE